MTGHARRRFSALRANKRNKKQVVLEWWNTGIMLYRRRLAGNFNGRDASPMRPRTVRGTVPTRVTRNVCSRSAGGGPALFRMFYRINRSETRPFVPTPIHAKPLRP